MTEQAPPAGPPDLAPKHELVSAEPGSTPAASRARVGAAAVSTGGISAADVGTADVSLPGASTADASSVTADTADVIVVGAGPAGSAASYYLAAAGLDVLMLEKTSFPREKVCGDGLTPRAVKALTAMGVPIAESDGWLRNKGLRIIGGGGRIELDWPEL